MSWWAEVLLWWLAVGAWSVLAGALVWRCLARVMEWVEEREGGRSE